MNVSFRAICLFIAVFSASLVATNAAPKSSPAAPTIIDDLKESPAERRAEKWKLDKPPYPYAARAPREQGRVDVEIITGQDGRVIKASVPKSKNHPILDVSAARWAYAHWHGPPNHRTVVPVTFALH